MISLPDRRHLIFLFSLLISLAAFSQEPVQVERSGNKVILEGKVYYIHVVKPGQTLYAISKAYNVSQKEIAVENPGVISGLQIGQALKIPVEPTLEEEIDTSEEQKTLEGKHTHRVQPGETLYGIARLYRISEASLRGANPAVTTESLRPGQLLNIPESMPETEETGPAYNEEGFAYHKVKKRETLYSIAKYYGVTVYDIRTANPELGWGGPQTGQVIRIPLPLVLDHPEMKMDTVPMDSLLQVRTDSLLEEYHYEELLEEHYDPNRTYRIAYFIPFDFQEQEPLDSLLKDVESVSRRNRIIERYRLEQKIPQSVNFMEFFLGSLLALDSMKRTGMRLDVSYFDTRKSIDQTRSLLEEEGMDEMDLMIGPFYPFNLEIIAAFAHRHRIPLVTPFYDEMEFIRTNPYLFQLSPSLEKGYGEIAKLVASKYMCNIVYVREEDSLDVEKHNYLQKLIFDDFERYRPEEPVIFKEMVLTLEHTNEIIQSLSADRKNVVVVPTGNEALASRVVSALYYRLKDFDIELIGTPDWTEFSSIDYRYYHELSLMFYSSFWMDYLNPKVDIFLQRYREYFNAEPQAMTRKGINYGIAGHDITLYFTNALRIYGHRFILYLDEYEPGLVLDPYRFSRVTHSGGFENTQISFYRFQPDMSIVEFQVPELPSRPFYFRPLDDRRRRFLYIDPDDN